MKIASMASGPDVSDAVDARFGRAPWFIIGDTDSDEWQGVENSQNMQAAQGAGIQSAACVSRHEVKAVLTGHCGPKAFGALSAAGVKVYVGVQGTVRDAIEQFKAGKLTEAGSADVGGHWTA